LDDSDTLAAGAAIGASPSNYGARLFAISGLLGNSAIEYADFAEAMMAAARTGSAVLHSLFELNEGVSEAEFATAFRAFFDHLQEKGFATGCRVMRRKTLEGFGRPLPSFTYYAAIEFHGLDAEQACYDYVAENAPPIRALHQAMNSKVRRGGSYFFVSADI
jgi:hypothetical protein